MLQCKLLNKKSLLISTILFIFSLSSCSNNTPNKTYNYNDYKEYFIKDKDFFNVNNEKYIIYFYGTFCSPCNELKKIVFDKINKGLNYLFFLNKDDIEEDFKYPDGKKSIEEMKSLMINKNKIEDIYLISTPTIYVINNKTLVEVFINYEECLNYLNTIKI